jgi:hypothetical protein
MAWQIISTLLFLGIALSLNLLGIPGYLVALVIGLSSGYSLLRKNQNGKVREKLAFVPAFVVAIVVYILLTGQAYGAYFGTIAFLCVRLGLTRIYRDTVDISNWLTEIVPPIFKFVFFERIGGVCSLRKKHI